MRTRLWLWLFTLAFAGFVLHATVCACEVVHPHHGSTKPCVIQCHSDKKGADRAAQPLQHLDALHPALLTLINFYRARPIILDRQPRFTLENFAPLLARGPPLAPTTITLSDTL